MQQSIPLSDSLDLAEVSRTTGGVWDA